MMPHKHRCLRCNEEFECQTLDCQAGHVVLPNIVTRDPDGNPVVTPHCPEHPDWAWIRAYGERKLATAREVIDASRCIRHWHDWGPENEGMVVSQKHVFALWEALEKYDAARQKGGE